MTSKYSTAKVNIITLFCLLSTIHGQEETPNKVKVSVYYESLCPDSKAFINIQLYPTLTKDNDTLFEHVRLALIPYGKSQSTFNEELKQYDFACHHGPDECKGNTIHACGLRKIRNGQIEEQYVARNALDFVNCLMENADLNAPEPRKFSTLECATQSHVQNYAEVENCANHASGRSYLANYGTRTEALKPTLSNVPTIVFNDMYNTDESKEAEKNFKTVLCRYLRKSNPNKSIGSCDQTGSAAINGPFMLMVLVNACTILFKETYSFS